MGRHTQKSLNSFTMLCPNTVLMSSVPGDGFINGFIIKACTLVPRKSSKSDADPTKGTVDADRFVLWLKENLVPILGKYALGEPRSVVILDNASIHQDSRVKEIIEAAGAVLIVVV